MQYPWRFTDSAYYKYLFTNPPKNVVYINQLGKTGAMESVRRFKFFNWLKQTIKGVVSTLKLPIPNAHYSKKGKYDLIHAAHCLSLNKKTPWVADIEHPGQLYIGNHPTARVKKITKKILMRKNCKKILAWTEWGKKGILKEFPEIEDKIEVIYPAMPAQKFKKSRFDGKIRLLFISRRFYFKGGLIAIEVMDRITKNNKNVEGIIVSEVPEDIRKKYSKNKQIKIIPVMPQEKLFKEIYPKADIFLYPSPTDTFGFGIIEAMSFGLPVIGLSGHSRKEIIEEGKTGYVIETGWPESIDEGLKLSNLENIDQMTEVISKVQKCTLKLMRDKKMGKNAKKEIETGKFSIKERNKKLRKIYRRSLEITNKLKS